LEIFNNQRFFRFREFLKTITDSGIKSFGAIDIDETGYSGQNIPDGWIWQDIGNYYGAGVSGLNWRENQFDLTLSSDDKIDGDVHILSTQPTYVKDYPFYNLLRSAEKGTGDNAYIYLQNGYYLVAGTIPRAEKNFKISGTMINPSENFKHEFSGELLKKQIRSEWNPEILRYKGEMSKKESYKYSLISSHYSPSLDSYHLLVK
jgi:D-alanyl-D-alanine carboxypeptidase/D-alanyl-D-alanine-endopeptidase (penicillin-binding protein 4)